MTTSRKSAKTNRAPRGRTKQLVKQNPVAAGAYRKVWMDAKGNPTDARGNPLAESAYEDVWGDVMGRPKGTRKAATQKAPVAVVAADAQLAPAKPSAPKRDYTLLRRVAQLDTLPQPLTLDSDDQSNNAIYFVDASGDGYLYKYRGPKARMSALRRFAVAETTSAKATKSDLKGVAALEAEMAAQFGDDAKLVVVEEAPATKPKATRKAAPKTRTTELRKPAAKTRKRPAATKPASARKPRAARAPAAASAAAALEAEMAAQFGAPAPSAPTGGRSADEDVMALLGNPRRRGYRRNPQFTQKETQTLITGFVKYFKASQSDAEGAVAWIQELMLDNPQTTEQLKVKIVKSMPKLLEAYRKKQAELAAAAAVEAAPAMDAPTAEEIVATVQGVAISGDEEVADRMVDTADMAALKRVYRMLFGGRGRYPAERAMRQAIKGHIGEQFNTFQDEDSGAASPAPGAFIKAVPVQVPAPRAPSDAALRAEAEKLLLAKIRELKGEAATSAPAPAAQSTGGPNKKLSPEELKAQLLAKIRKMKNPRRRTNKRRRR